MCYVLHVCSFCDIAAQTRLIEFDGNKNISYLANYNDDEIDSMADGNSKHTPVTQQVRMGFSQTEFESGSVSGPKENSKQGQLDSPQLLSINLLA